MPVRYRHLKHRCRQFYYGDKEDLKGARPVRKIKVHAKREIEGYECGVAVDPGLKGAIAFILTG